MIKGPATAATATPYLSVVFQVHSGAWRIKCRAAGIADIGERLTEIASFGDAAVPTEKRATLYPAAVEYVDNNTDGPTGADVKGRRCGKVRTDDSAPN